MNPKRIRAWSLAAACGASRLHEIIAQDEDRRSGRNPCLTSWRSKVVRAADRYLFRINTLIAAMEPHDRQAEREKRAREAYEFHPRVNEVALPGQPRCAPSRQSSVPTPVLMAWWGTKAWFNSSARSMRPI